jgi:hypothetical protein
MFWLTAIAGKEETFTKPPVYEWQRTKESTRDAIAA